MREFTATEAVFVINLCCNKIVNGIVVVAASQQSRTPVQDKTKEEINILNSRILSIYLESKTVGLSSDLAETLKKSMEERELLEKKLKRKRFRQNAQGTFRKKKGSKNSKAPC